MTSAPPAREIRVHIRDPWVSVPQRLMEAGCGLSPEARLTLIYMLDLGRRPGWTIYIAQVQRAIGLGPRRWPRIRRELEAQGYFISERGHAANGDWAWTYHVYDTPAGIPSPGIPAKCMDADCGDANRVDRRSSTSPNSTSERAAANAREQEQPVAAAAREKGTAACRSVGIPAPSADRRRRTHSETGIVYWLDDEPSEIERLVRVHGIDATRAVVDEIQRRGQDPLPSIVAKRLQAVRRDEVEARARQARRQRPTAAERAEDARRAREAMAAFKAARDAPEQPRHRDTRTMEQILADWAGPRVIP